MSFPIKFMDNNLVFNKYNECFAYYELIPYNYSFLSQEEREEIKETFRQMVAQYNSGKFHALEIATETSVTAIQEQSKKQVKGNLKEVAFEMIDDQTDFLVREYGDKQMEYRFFIGFKLVLTEQLLTLKNLEQEVKKLADDFFKGIAQTLMGDYVSMNDHELARFMKMERFLYNKISRRFSIRKLSKDEMGYILDFIYCQNNEVFEDYYYHLPIVKRDGKTFIKKYDLSQSIYCKMQMSERKLQIENEKTGRTTHIAYMPMSIVVDGLEPFGSEFFYQQQRQFDFPISVSMNVEVEANKKALTTIRNKQKTLRDKDNHALESDNETPMDVLEAIEDTNFLENSLKQNKEPMYHLSYVVRVEADNEDELKERCDIVRDFYAGMDVKLARPLGDMKGLHEEFIPSGKRHLKDYIQTVESDFLATLGFGATQELGEKTGMYVGYNRETEKWVYIQPDLPAQGVKGSTTNSLSMSFTGTLGGGKSMAMNLIIYQAILRGAKAVILDPKAERGNWKADLPEISHEINIVNFTTDEKNKGMLDPFAILKNPKEAEALALDVLTYLTGISIADDEKFPTLQEAIERVTKSKTRGLLKVIDELENEGTEVSLRIARHLRSFTKTSFAQLLFGDGTRQDVISLDKQLNILQISGLQLPEKDKEVSKYSPTEMLSVVMLTVVSTFALDFIHHDRSVFKIFAIDEAWSVLKVAQGEALTKKLERAGRSMNSSIMFGTQNADDYSSEMMKSNIGMKFAFKCKGEEVKRVLRFFELDEEDEYNQHVLKTLENGQCLYDDMRGRKGILCFEVLFDRLFRAFDTRPPQENEGDEDERT